MISDDVRALRRELDRVVRELRRSGQVGFAPRPAPATWPDAAHELAQLLADAAADARGEQRRDVPRLGSHAVADQVAVIGRELLETLTDIAQASAGADAGTDVEHLRAAVAELNGLLLTDARR